MKSASEGSSRDKRESTDGTSDVSMTLRSPTLPSGLEGNFTRALLRSTFFTSARVLRLLSLLFSSSNVYPFIHMNQL